MSKPRIIILGILIILFIVYWSVLRPYNIRKGCKIDAMEDFSSFDSGVLGESYDKEFDQIYQECLVKRGLKK